MATHAHSTRTPLLPPVGVASPLLGRGSGRQPGPVTLAIRAVRTTEPPSSADAAIEAIREGLDRHLADADRRRVRELRRAIADRIEADIALLDALSGDVDFEETGDLEPSFGMPWDHEREEDDSDAEPDAEGEPSLGSLGGTAEGCEGSQVRWASGGQDDKEIGAPNAVHHREGLLYEPGEALTAARDWSRRRLRRGDVGFLADPYGAFPVARMFGGAR